MQYKTKYSTLYVKLVNEINPIIIYFTSAENNSEVDLLFKQKFAHGKSFWSEL